MQRFLLFFFLLCFSLSISRSAFGRGAAEAHCFFVPPANVPYDFFSRFTAKQVWIDSLVRILILILGSGLAFFNSDRTEKKNRGSCVRHIGITFSHPKFLHSLRRWLYSFITSKNTRTQPLIDLRMHLGQSLSVHLYSYFKIDQKFSKRCESPPNKYSISIKNKWK